MTINKINIAQKLALFNDYWNPRIAGELNGQHIKLVKFKGEFVWHKHENEDEMFLVIKGGFTMELRDKAIELKEGEMIIIPKGTEHRPVAKDEVQIMLFEPVSTLNTGNVQNEFTKDSLERLPD
jgi:mannose-6-phosphate isomerase-like protein (cupin superfamily)